MSHILTVKIPSLLLERLEAASHAKGQSKGALVREALEMLLVRPSSKIERIETITKAILQKRPRIKAKDKVDWQQIYKDAAKGPDITPEEEVRRSRRRGL